MRYSARVASVIRSPTTHQQTADSSEFKHSARLVVVLRWSHTLSGHGGVINSPIPVRRAARGGSLCPGPWPIPIQRKEARLLLP